MGLPECNIMRKNTLGRILLTSALAFLLAAAAGCAREPPQYPEVLAQGNGIHIPVSQVNDGKVHFFAFKYEDKGINFLVRTDRKGNLRTHYDACYSCYKYKRGFRVTGNKILCIACGLTYDLGEEEWDFIGPCSPIPLKSRIRGEDLVIHVERIKRGKKLF